MKVDPECLDLSQTENTLHSNTRLHNPNHIYIYISLQGFQHIYLSLATMERYRKQKFTSHNFDVLWLATRSPKPTASGQDFQPVHHGYAIKTAQ